MRGFAPARRGQRTNSFLRAISRAGASDEQETAESKVRMRFRWLLVACIYGLATAGAGPAWARVASRTRIPAFAQSTLGPLPLRAHPRVALTFDDLPAAGGLTPGETRTAIAARLAGELRSAHLKRTYGFVTAADLVNDSDAQKALRTWVGAGMNIGNHTWSHPSLTTTSAAAYEHEIALDEPALRQYAHGRDWHWFRYPYLEEGDTQHKRDAVRGWLHRRRYRVAEVTLTFQDDDWSDPYGRCVATHNQAGIAWLEQSYLQNAAEFIQLGRQEEEIAYGREIPNVLLLHETAFTARMLPSLVQLLHQEGFRFTSLARAEKDRAYSMNPGTGHAYDGPVTNQFLNAHHLKYPPFTPEPLQRLNSICR
jgi:peptidoglycan-N-acetylglucosamine deacetylase